MSRFTIVCLVFNVVLMVSSASAQQPHKIWWEFLQGEWTYENSESSGTVVYSYAAKKNAVVARFKDKNGDVSIELLGRDAAANVTTATGFASDGGSWSIEFTRLTKDTGEGTMRNVLEDESHIESEFEIKRTGENGFEWTSSGKDSDGNKIERWGKFKKAVQVK